LQGGLSIVQATYPLQYKSGATYRFLIGDVAKGECGSMYFQIPQTLNNTHCIQVFAATAIPCSAETDAMQTGRTIKGDATIGINTQVQVTQLDDDASYTAVGYTDPIFEDHVFLDFVFTWDSLMSILNDLQIYTIGPGDSASAGTSSIVVLPLEKELPTHATAIYCNWLAASNDDAQFTSSGTTNNSSVGNVNNSTTNATAALSTTKLDNKKALQVALFPNPVEQEAIIEAKGYEFDNLQLEVFNAVGQRVAYKQSNENRFVLHVQQWKQGVYYYRLSAGGTVLHNERFIVR
jgi:hypothetical protein